MTGTTKVVHPGYHDVRVVVNFNQRPGVPDYKKSAAWLIGN
jgi:hypothetical protein